MTLKDIQELIKLITKTEVSEFKYKDEQVSLHIRGKSYSPASGSGNAAPAGPSIISVPAPAAQNYAPAPAPPPAAPQAAAPEAPAKSGGSGDSGAKLLEVKSPMIGTFYRSASPDKPPYVKVGDRIAKGDTVCIVEAMKLFNEIESEVAGKIVKVLVEDAQPIEYDQPLFLVDPS
ncbi:acetyl-CoA carboxylase biotin carboxyl carrier protein [Lewinella marina]|uniref:Biotin carboxyl carrier protein of acetyl-CoA carboxylase n=1 Tax=Neolewinella marina TaxID=438751 RepID=A0A2G0CH19_9BACT|nr:acetyl-CoA carboxylase biotin carboxyl carrier protein [Neolewinella marina]NJB86260.1 acetyl-CoA carboxylase biotin carboxyl carrier protein [Neolewinella marina]PHK99266.1 acetyl-CoA carboxylase, biotin carboxyl carrier protein [Neolewinella marina]